MFKKIRRNTAIAVAACVAIFLVSEQAQAATLKEEFPFYGSGVGSGGAVPLNGNLLYSNQQLYGVTYAGGMIVGPNEEYISATDLGSIYQYAISGPGVPINLYGFSGPDGSHPNGGLVADAQGNLYGTTQDGGANNMGTVFKLSPPQSAGGTWTLTTLHSFAGTDGETPLAGVTIGPNGNLYGTTSTLTGSNDPCCGNVFTLSTTGTGFHVMAQLYPNAGPRTNVVVDPQGNVIGTTYMSTVIRGEGSLFKVTPSGTYSTVTIFQESGAITAFRQPARSATSCGTRPGIFTACSAPCRTMRQRNPGPASSK